MKADESIEHFLGKNGKKNINCAQAHSIVFGKDNKRIDELKKYGVGKAPGGECGIYYAGKSLLIEKNKINEIGNYTNFFQEMAGSTLCKELRIKKIPFCAECLGKSVSYIEKVI